MPRPGSIRIVITPRPLRLGDLEADLRDAGSGGVVYFVGRVRQEHRRGTTVLRYEVYERMVTRELTRLAKQARRDFGSRRVAIRQRVGFLRTGEPSVMVGVAAAHRREAFAACRFLIDHLKKEAPIWKTPAGGGAEAEKSDCDLPRRGLGPSLAHPPGTASLRPLAPRKACRPGSRTGPADSNP